MLYFSGIHLPLYPPSVCKDCGHSGTLNALSDSKTCIVVTKEGLLTLFLFTLQVKYYFLSKLAFYFQIGRFYLYMVKFECNNCSRFSYPTYEDCVSSGFWPGTPQRMTVFFNQDVLKFWHILRLLTPGISENKFIECLSALSLQAGRNPVIDK